MDEFNLIDQVEYNPPIGKSDHVVLEWDIKLTSDDMISSKKKLDYWKGDYMRSQNNYKRLIGAGSSTARRK